MVVMCIASGRLHSLIIFTTVIYDLLERKMPDWRRVKSSLEVNFG